ncbi:hypothetical protein T01_7506 [Trichinella spiralis]|uniref:Uncharacterized protein n=1 Tax=Trichinella spiralis TaxID=6334 RepID=A0A0V1BM58_TRISP|nr:hypothetical protein T01_7506 [Trichinella spiralis]
MFFSLEYVVLMHYLIGHVTTSAVRRRCSLQFKVATGEDRGWLLATDPHDTTSRGSPMIRWGSGSKPPRNKPLIYRRAASRETVSKTIGGDGSFSETER